MRFPRLLGAAAVLALAAVAAPAAQAQRTPDPTALGRLERAHAADPRSLGAVRALGIAYYEAGRYADARAMLAQAQSLGRNDGTVALFLGLSAEHTGDLAVARDAYVGYLAHGRSGRTKRQVRARLGALKRLELQQAARDAVAREASFAADPGAPNTVAVLPLRFSGVDSTLAPLERGFSDLLVTDLSRSARLTVLERERMQALVDEIARSQGGRTDAATAVRGGRMLRAGRVVQGSLTQLPDHRLQVDAAVVDVPTSQALKAVQHGDQLEQLFSLEKKTALDLFGALGVSLTASERARIEERPTRSLAAFLAYSAGLMAEDNGRLDDASRHYSDALRIDPQFQMALAHRATVEAARAGEGVTTGTIEATLAGTTEGTIADAAGHGTILPDVPTGPQLGAPSTVTEVVNGLNPSPAGDAAGGTNPPARDPASTTTGTDNPASKGTIRIVVPQPTARRARP